MTNIIDRYIELPVTVNAVTVLDSNGDYNVYINSNLSLDERIRAFNHELRHIMDEHFYKDMPVPDCEKFAKEGKSR